MMEIENIRYRVAVPEDHEKVVEFAMQALYDAKLPRFAQDVGEALVERIKSGEPGNVIIAEDITADNMIVGYLEIDANRSKPRKAFYIGGIYVLPEYRRRHVGKNLFLTMLKEKCKHDEQIRVEAITEDELRFWKSLGFKIHHYSMFYDPHDNGSQ